MTIISTPWWTGVFDVREGKEKLVEGFLNRVSKLIYKNVDEEAQFILQIDKSRLLCLRKKNTEIDGYEHMVVTAYDNEFEYTFPVYSSWDNAQPTITPDTSTVGYTAFKNKLAAEWEKAKDQFNLSKQLDKSFNDF